MCDLYLPYYYRVAVSNTCSVKLIMNMMRHTTIVLFLSFFIASHSHAQTVEEDPIDATFKTCLLKDTSTVCIRICAYTAYDNWNNEMSKVYKKLLKTLKKEKDKSALKQSQAAWTNYRDAEFKSYDNMFNISGNFWCRTRAMGRIDVVRSRAMQLRTYLADIKRR